MAKAKHKKDDDYEEEEAEEAEEVGWCVILGGVFMVSIPALWLCYKCIMIFVTK